MNDTRTRPVSVTHLVFGLIFLGAAGLWAIGAATGVDTPDLAVLAPAVLVAAGVLGLVAMVINARNARVDRRREERFGPAYAGTDNPDTDTAVTDTVHTEEQP
jgi:hypothetical protein